MSEPHPLRINLREPTFALLNQLRVQLGAGSYAEVIRRSLDELAEKVGVHNGQIRSLENDAGGER